MSASARFDGGGYGLAVALRVTIPGAGPARARALAEAAHQVCPYSNATRGNIEVTLESPDLWWELPAAPRGAPLSTGPAGRRCRGRAGTRVLPGKDSAMPSAARLLGA